MRTTCTQRQQEPFLHGAFVGALLAESLMLIPRAVVSVGWRDSSHGCGGFRSSHCCPDLPWASRWPGRVARPLERGRLCNRIARDGPDLR
jgi:hypothetical protein